MKKNMSMLFVILVLSLLFVFTAKAQNNDNSDKNDKKTEKQEKDRPLKILSKPSVQIGNCEQSSGSLTLRVNFDKTAKITDIEIIKSSDCTSFNENAIKAARAIKFSPAFKNGEPITVNKLVQYDFRRF